MPLSGIGFGEMLVIAMLVLIVFGPQRLPEITRSVGKAMREFKRGMNEIQRELEVADRQQKWSDSSKPSAARSAASASASPTAAATAGTAATAASRSGSGDAAGGGGSGSPQTAEPMIAPPSFGSDLPDEVQSQLAPLPTETAANPRRAKPLEPPAGASGEDPAEMDRGEPAAVADGSLDPDDVASEGGDDESESVEPPGRETL
ncbi:MAG: twin-arginine translocase TatA/TatE family subunit [Gemmatimonadota bacterium]|nr:twin-arginine translocase TatA/TatE family subunit [Gemmatimonadota bacterium]